jgi:hypothetical protein
MKIDEIGRLISVKKIGQVTINEFCGIDYIFKIVLKKGQGINLICQTNKDISIFDGYLLSYVGAKTYSPQQLKSEPEISTLLSLLKEEQN